MRLKYITASAVFCILLLLVGVYLTASHFIIYPSFSSIEDQFARENIQRCKNAIQRELYHLDLFNKDWASWDDTYEFIVDLNNDYITSNLTDEAFEISNVQLMYFLNDQNLFAWQHIHDPDDLLSENQIQEINRLLTDLIPRVTTHEDGIGVLIKTSAFPLLLTAKPIYDSEESKPHRGHLIMGRFLNASTVQVLTEQTQVSFDIHPLAADVSMYAANDDIQIVKNSSDNLIVSSVYQDLDGKPAYLIQATLPRSITRAGKKVIVCSLAMIISTSFVLLALLLHLLNRNIVFPISSLTAQIRNLRQTKSLDQLIEMPTGHETRILATEFNHLIGQLEADRSKRLDVEEQLRQTVQKAEHANQAKSDFLANMSHEIRTPMNSILGFSDLLLSENLPDDQKEYIETIHQNGTTLLSLINDILDMSKIESGNMEIETIECSIDKLSKEIKSFLLPLASKKSLEFNVTRQQGLPDMLMTDPLRLRQCLINLLGNAIKFTDNGYVRLNIFGDGSTVCFEVQDTGVGISDPQMEKIFSPFTQADTSTTRKFGGTGLGLSITQKLTQLLGGKLTVKSQPGKGSTFTITLPLQCVDHHHTDINQTAS